MTGFLLSLRFMTGELIYQFILYSKGVFNEKTVLQQMADNSSNPNTYFTTVLHGGTSTGSGGLDGNRYVQYLECKDRAIRNRR
jgi:hypothetical protein